MFDIHPHSTSCVRPSTLGCSEELTSSPIWGLCFCYLTECFVASLTVIITFRLSSLTCLQASIKETNYSTIRLLIIVGGNARLSQQQLDFFCTKNIGAMVV